MSRWCINPTQLPSNSPATPKQEQSSSNMITHTRDRIERWHMSTRGFAGGPTWINPDTTPYFIYLIVPPSVCHLHYDNWHVKRHPPHQSKYHTTWPANTIQRRRRKKKNSHPCRPSRKALSSGNGCWRVLCWACPLLRAKQSGNLSTERQLSISPSASPTTPKRPWDNASATPWFSSGSPPVRKIQVGDEEEVLCCFRSYTCQGSRSCVMWELMVLRFVFAPSL